MNNFVQIDLAKYKSSNAKFIVGRKNGADARLSEKLDELVEKCKNGKISKIEFITSEEIYGVVSSFILGMLSEIVTKINNKQSVYDIFSFDKLNNELKQQFEEEINYILGE